MNVGKPVFAFTPHESACVAADVGRNDIAAISFVADAEACLHAFDYASSGKMSAGLPAKVAGDLATIVHAAAQLRSALYALPEDIAMLIDLHLLSEGAKRRIAADFSQLVEPLEDIAGAIIQIQHANEVDSSRNNAWLEDHLVRALAAAFRNRFNRKPTDDDESGFPATLTNILKFAGHRLPGVAASTAAITPMRLRELLGPSTKPARRK